ncbi:MAG: hypothetical protein DRI69_01820 [Bacteroidetes bacterium]|nr:MAG: hypothetical protein DRI69_01820 [Bacteroidota bacterium]
MENKKPTFEELKDIYDIVVDEHLDEYFAWRVMFPGLHAFGAETEEAMKHLITYGRHICGMIEVVKPGEGAKRNEELDDIAKNL